MGLAKELSETAKSREFRISAAIFLLLAINFNSWTVWSDGHAYFAILESMVQDRDFDLTNQYNEYGGIYLVGQIKGTGKFVSPYGFGAPLLNAPLYAVSLAIEKATEINIRYNGYSLLRTASVNITANILALLAMLFCFTAIKKIGLKISAASMAALVISTPLFFYASLTPSFTHAADAFILSLFVLLFISLEKEKNQKKQFLPGAILGFAAIVRYYNAFLLPFTVLFFALQKQWKKTLFFSIGFLSVAWAIPVYWNIGMGEEGIETAAILANDVTPNILPVHALELLFSPVHGLLLWSPIVILSLVGLWLLYKEKKNRKIALFLAGLFATLVISYGRTEIWSAGWSFSNRYLAGLFPVFAIGFAAFEKRFGKKATAIAIILTLYSAFILLNEAFAFIDGVQGTPIDVFQNWLSGKTTAGMFLENLYKFTLADNIVNFFAKGG